MQNANGNPQQNTQFPSLYLEPSVSTTTVVTTTTTTTTYAPIPLPATPSSSASPPKDGKEYPLYNVRLPPSVREFNLVFPGGKRAFFRDQSVVNDGNDAGVSNFGGEELASGRGWRMLPREENQSTSSPQHTIPVVGLNEALEGYSKKRERGHEFEFESIAMEDTPARKKARAPPSPLPSPHGSPPPDAKQNVGYHTQVVQAPTPTTPFEPDLSLTTLLTLPSLMNHFTSLPESLQSHVLLMLLRQSPLPVLRTLHSVLHPTLARDFLTLLPPELVSHILGFVTVAALGRACRVCKAWRGRIEGDKVLWRDLLVRTGLWFGGETEANFVKMLNKKRRTFIVHEGALPLAHPYKVLFKSRYLTYTRWINNPSPKHIEFAAHGHSVVTCLLFSQNRIISASDDHSIHVYSPTTGRLLLSLDGHEGGVWALAAHGNLLVSGSTDRTVRIWDLQDGRCLHVFGGHTSTVRCLAIVKPEMITHPDTGEREKWPKRTVVVTGSRDHTLRVWRLPKRGEREFDSRVPQSPSASNIPPPPTSPDLSDPPDPSLNPYHLHLLSGHSHAVRALAARGRTLVSGSYDCTVRVWDIPTGRLVHTLTGHTQKVYSVVLDSRDGTWGSEGWGYGSGGGTDGRAASGSMDGTVRLWSITTGECLHVLSGHTSLVGLLGLSPSFLVSAAADSTLRVWDARLPNDRRLSANAGSSSGDLLRGVMTGHTGAITCFQHDEWKVVSGSDGTLKVWDLRDLNNAANTASTGGAGGWGTGGAGGGWAAAGPIPGAAVPAGGPGPAPGVAVGGTVPVVRDLLTGITGVWQVAFEGRWCVSASNRNDITVLDVWDFSKIESAPTLDPATGSSIVDVDEGSEEREREVKHGGEWTWEDEEWVGEPSGGVYDHEDSEVESDIEDSASNLDFHEDRDDDGDIELISVHGDRDDDDDDIVYTGRRSASTSSLSISSVHPTAASGRPVLSKITVPAPQLVSKLSTSVSDPTFSHSRRSTRAMSEVSRASERSTRSRGSNSRMEVDVDIDVDVEVLPEVQEEPGLDQPSEDEDFNRFYGDLGDDRDAEIVEDMMEVDRDFGDSKRSSQSQPSKRQRQEIKRAGDDDASDSKGRASSGSRATRNSSANPVPSSSNRRITSSTRALAGSYVGRRGQGPSTSARTMEAAEDPRHAVGDGLGDEGEVRMTSPGIGMGANGKGSSKRRWL
ncbi:WD40-repeat-containing domain protein [Rhodocollybia butyracea]|uniref:WD40-repeat-containing domain protein n=1 Tax=Rhodocollybia butyracea TaxID=206335 RepID=A0A9P5P6Z4_9AGAR|nr:WD40-repeat-containing domain protein [Rhodocollybia butyracea]